MPSFFNARQLMFSAQYSSCIITISISTTVSTKTITTIETLAIQSLYVKGSTIINGLLMFSAWCSQLFLQYNNDNLYNSVNENNNNNNNNNNNKNNTKCVWQKAEQ